ncbi:MULTISPECIES: hypothetical protein [Nonomuraea]|uniref:hypothetical protein n=1 Tax=Nonomuraea TaxID=83681 RepID=UPI0012F9E755|nr:hypothetical protein [Nonomuraea typhae]
MAYPTSRSMSAELAEGITDGAVRKPAPDRGGLGHSPANAYPGHVMTGVIGPKGGLA